MAKLTHTTQQQTLYLHNNHTLGRDACTNITALNIPAASRSHAIIAWDGAHWMIKDISKNGTFINRLAIKPNTFYPLNVNDHIQFGDLSPNAWQVADLAPPVTCLAPLVNGLPVIQLFDIEIISAGNTELMIYLDDRNHWQCDDGQTPRPLADGDRVGANGQFWAFLDARASTATQTFDVARSADDIIFHFSANSNEEHVTLKIDINNTTVDLGERNHHYLLLLLAKQRLEDTHKGLPDHDQGWVNKDVLCHMMGMIEQHINIQIHRFRKQVAAVMPESPLQQIIERRPGELRLAHRQLTIKGGFQQLQPA